MSLHDGSVCIENKIHKVQITRSNRMKAMHALMSGHIHLGGVEMLNAMKRLIEIFAACSPDRSTLDELQEMIDDRRAWPRAHDLFQRIRSKTLAAERQRDAKMGSQFYFEEVCAKALYNLTELPAPFDADSPYWIVPNALTAARYFGVDQGEVLKAIQV